MILAVRVVPNASRDECAGRMDDGAWKIKLRAPAVEGKANKALIAFLAEALDVPKSVVSIVSGDTARQKRVQVPDDADLSRLK